MPDQSPHADPDAAALRARAGGAVRAIADRLAVSSPGIHGRSRLSLAEGHPGLALLFAELAHHDPGYAGAAGTHLDLAQEWLVAGATDGLFDGVAAVAFAARAASRSPGRSEEYDELLTSLDRHVTARANTLVVAEHTRTTAGAPGAEPTTYDVTHGLTGLGAYLLTARKHSLADVLSALVALSDPVTVAGRPVPGWWVREGTGTADGYLALGMAHGIAGPLALMALAWRAGVRVTDQEQAIRRVAASLSAAAFDDDAGTHWSSTLPTTVPGSDAAIGGGVPRVDGGVGWCGGAPGIARALQLAGAVLDVPEWSELAVTALVDAVDRALDQGGAPAAGTSLCHGWAGALHVTWRVATDTGDKRLLVRTHRLAERLLDGLDAAPPEEPGLLHGAAGVALALHTYSRDAAPASGWDRALLVS